MTPYSLYQPPDVCCPSDTACRNSEHDTSPVYVTATANAAPETAINTCYDVAEDERPCYTQHDRNLDSDALNGCECLDVHGRWIRVNAKDKVQYCQDVTHNGNRYSCHESQIRLIERRDEYFDEGVPVCSGSALNSGAFVTKEYYVMGGEMKSCLVIGEETEGFREEWYHGGGNFAKCRDHAAGFHCDRSSRSTSVGMECQLLGQNQDGAGLPIYDGDYPPGNGCPYDVVGSREGKIYTDLDHPSRSENDVYTRNDDVCTRNDDEYTRNDDVYTRNIYGSRNEVVFRAHYGISESLNSVKSYHEFGGERGDRYYTDLDEVHLGSDTDVNTNRQHETASSVSPSWGQENVDTVTFQCSREKTIHLTSKSGFKRAETLIPEWSKDKTHTRQLKSSKDEAKRTFDHRDIYRSASYKVQRVLGVDKDYKDPENSPRKRTKYSPQTDNVNTVTGGQREKYCFMNQTQQENINVKSVESSESNCSIEDQCSSEKDNVGSKQDETKPKDGANSNMILPPCRICGAKASGFHYGVNSCEACKGFFRRALKRPMVFHCTKDKTCDVKGNKRSSCRFCRFKRCLKLGMSKEAIKTGRYSHKKRTKDTIEVKMLQKEEPVVSDEQDIGAILDAIFSADETRTKSSATIPESDLIGRQIEYHINYTSRKRLGQISTDNYCVKSDKNESFCKNIRSAIVTKQSRTTRENEASENSTSKLNSHAFVSALNRQQTLTNTPLVLKQNEGKLSLIHPQSNKIHKTNADLTETILCPSKCELFQSSLLPKKKKMFVENAHKEEQQVCGSESQTSRLNITNSMGSNVRAARVHKRATPREDVQRARSAAGVWAPVESTELINTVTTPAMRSPTSDQSGVSPGENNQESKSAVIARAENWVMGYIGFARSLPGFSLLPSQDQANLLQHAWDEVWILEAHRGYNCDLEVATMPSGKCFHIDEMEIGWGKEYARLAFSMAEIIKRHNLSPELITMLKAVCIVSPDRCELMSRKEVENLHWTVVTYLVHYLEMKHQDDPLLLARLISILTSLREISETARSGQDAASAENIFASNMLTNMFAPF